MHTRTTVKLTSCIVAIWATLIMDYSSCARRDDEIVESLHLTSSTTTTQSPPAPQNKSTGVSGKNTTDPKNEKIQLPNTQNITNGSAEYFSDQHSPSQNLALRSKDSIQYHSEETSFSKSVWLYITIGILCVAAFNVYMFWYRKRTTTYSFPPTGTATTRARR